MAGSRQVVVVAELPEEVERLVEMSVGLLAVQIGVGAAEVRDAPEPGWPGPTCGARR